MQEAENNALNAVKTRRFKAKEISEDIQGIAEI